MRREIAVFALGFAAGVVTLAVGLWAAGNFRPARSAVLVGQPVSSPLSSPTVSSPTGIVDTVRGTPPPPVATPVPAPVLIGKASLGMPIEGLDPLSVPGTFDQKRGDHPHEALDIMAPRGAPVHAVDQGNVVKLFTSKQGGLTVYQFDDARQLCYYYAHLDRYAVGLKEGTLLRRGDVLGYVGSTGNASPAAPHLHFAIFELGPEKEWWKGKAIDPLPLFQGR